MSALNNLINQLFSRKIRNPAYDPCAEGNYGVGSVNEVDKLDGGDWDVLVLVAVSESSVSEAAAADMAKAQAINAKAAAEARAAAWSAAQAAKDRAAKVQLADLMRLLEGGSSKKEVSEAIDTACLRGCSLSRMLKVCIIALQKELCSAKCAHPAYDGKRAWSDVCRKLKTQLFLKPKLMDGMDALLNIRATRLQMDQEIEQLVAEIDALQHDPTLM